jgi:ABC-2 type transport system permease protein
MKTKTSVFYRLLRLRWAFWSRRMKEWISDYPLQCLIYLLLIIIFWSVCFFSTSTTIRNIHDTLLTIGPFLVDRMMMIFLLSIFIMLIYTNLLASFSILFNSDDLQLLMASPISVAGVFNTKVWESLLLGSWTYLAFGLPIFAGYGYAHHAPFYYYPIMILGTLPFAMLSGAVGITLSLLLGGLSQNRRIRFAGMIFCLLILLIIFSLRDVISSAPDHQNLAAHELLKWELSTSFYHPHFWLNRLLNAVMMGNVADCIMYLMVLWGAAIVALRLLGEAGRHFYLLIWQNSMQSGRSPDHRKEWLLATLLMLPLGLLRRSTRSVIEKDMRIFFRDMTQWGQMMIVLSLLVVYIVQLSFIDFTESKLWFLNSMVLFNMAILGFVMAALSIRFAFPSLSLEGRAIWSLASSSLTLRRLFRLKWTFHFCWMISLTALLIVFTSRFLFIHWSFLVAAAIDLVLLAMGMVSLSIGIAALYPRFYAKNAAEINSGTGAMVCIILSMSYLMVTTLCLAAPLLPFLSSANPVQAAAASNIMLLVCSWALCLIIHLLTCIMAFRIGQRRFESISL